MCTMPQLTNRVRPCIHGIRDALPLQLPRQNFRKVRRGEYVLAPPTDSQPLPRCVRGPLSVPYRPGTLAYRLQVKTRSGACIHALPRVLHPQTQPPCRDGLRCYHTPYSSEPHLPAQTGSEPHHHIEEGFGAATCYVAPCLACLSRRALTLSRVARLRTSPP
jgi:hypothetical protein